jgi:hypothetical protein
LRVFIIESPNPKDVLEERSEQKPLEYICKAMGHQAFSFFVKSSREFEESCSYISSLEGDNSKSIVPLCIHISAHGNKEGLCFGPDFLDWDEVAELLLPILEMEYKEEIFLIVSACGTDNQKISHKIQNLRVSNSKLKPPKYIIVFNQEKVNWDDAILAWTILYHQIEKINYNEKESVMGLLDRIKGSRFGSLVYRRWNNKKKKYIRYIPSEPKEQEDLE